MAAVSRRTVVGVFESRDDAHCAEQALKDAGFRDDQIGIAMRGESGMTDTEHGTKAAEGAVGGAVTGGVVGGLLGAAASLILPGIGPVVAGGILATTLAGAATGAVAGGLLGALVGLGVPEEEARFYDSEFQAGRIIMTTNADGRYDEAYRILQDCGAYDMQTRPATSVGRDEAIRLREDTELDVDRDEEIDYRDKDRPLRRDRDIGGDL